MGLRSYATFFRLFTEKTISYLSLKISINVEGGTLSLSIKSVVILRNKFKSYEKALSMLNIESYSKEMRL